jgi:DNA-binding XRE family transcriptional regulator
MNPKLLKNLKITRVGLGYTHATFAPLINIAPQTYGKIERGGTEMTIERLQQIAAALGINKAVLRGI